MAKTAKGAMGAARGADLDEYLALVRAFPLAHIRDDAHLDAAVAVIDRLLDKGDCSPAEEMYLDALTDLVETYEEAHVPIPARSGVHALRFPMEANDLKQVDLVPVLDRKSLVSEVLSGKRPLALTHIKKLAAYFRVSPAVFID
jgi:HTH-type transcriptional regulator/antitoxin HigA